METVKWRMSAYMKVQLKQCAVIEFLTAEGIAPIDIHRRMSAVDGEACVDISTIRRWVRGSWTENPAMLSVHDKPHCGRPKTADSAEHTERVNELICDNRHIKHAVCSWCRLILL